MLEMFFLIKVSITSTMPDQKLVSYLLARYLSDRWNTQNLGPKRSLKTRYV
jgi:hypothetical protein